MLPNWNATDTMRKQILFANYPIRNSGTGLTTLGSHLIIVTHVSSNIWIQPKRQSVLLLKRSICLCTLLNWTESFKWCCLRKVFRTSSFFFFPLFFLRHKRSSCWNSLHLKKNLLGPNHCFYKLKKPKQTNKQKIQHQSYIVALDMKLIKMKHFPSFSLLTELIGTQRISLPVFTKMHPESSQNVIILNSWTFN